MREHTRLELERKLAALKGAEDAVVFGSGYLTNLGVIPALVGRADLILLDELCHSCLLAGAAMGCHTAVIYVRGEFIREREHLQAAVDQAYEARLIGKNNVHGWDFDIIVASWGQSLSPGNEQRGFWGSQAADQPGSRNLMGIKDPAIDSLIEQVIFATSRADLVAATKALDRVLLHNHFLVPQWTYGKSRTARWDRYARPAELPKYGVSAFPTVWWWVRTMWRKDAKFRTFLPQREQPWF